MSRTAVLAYCASQCAPGTMTGVVTCTTGRPTKQQIDTAACPWIILGVPQPRWTPETFAAGGAGYISTQYPVNIVVVMGRADMAPQDAEAARALWADRVRYAFAPDPSMGGLVFEAELVDGIDNIDTFRDSGQQPQAAFHLLVTEWATRNAAVA